MYIIDHNEVDFHYLPSKSQMPTNFQQPAQPDNNGEVEKYDWWYHNKWYATTSFSGFRYIYYSKTVKEAIFWYLIVAILYTLALILVFVDVSNYFSRPTRTNAQASSGMKSTRLPDISVVIRFPLIEYDRDFVKRNLEDKHPCMFLNEQEDGYGSEAMRNILETTTRLLNKYHRTGVTGFYANSLAEFMQAKGDIGTSPLVNGYPAAWYQALSGRNMDYGDEKNGSVRVGSPYRYYQMPDDLSELERNIVTKFSINTWSQYAWTQALLDLEALMENQNDTRKANLEHLKSIKIPPVLLWEKIIKSLGQYFQLEIITDTGEVPEAFLVQSSLLEPGVQENTYQMKVPEGMKEVTTIFHTYNFAKVTNRVEEFVTFYDKELNDSQKAILCPGHAKMPNGPEALSILRKSLHDRITRPMEEYYKELAHITMKTPGGNLVVKPFTVTKHKLIPTAQFVSETRNCYKKSIDECEHECMGSHFLQTCKCIPWTLFYANTDKKEQLCDHSCRNNDNIELTENECYEKCIEDSAHSCKSSLFRLEEDTNIPGEDFFTITVTLDRHTTYPMFVEKYAYSLSSFVANIGAILCFWVGIRVIGLVHTVYYFIKQCCHARKPDSKVRKTLKNMKTKGKSKVQQADPVPNRNQIYSIDQNFSSEAPPPYEGDNADMSRRMINCEMKLSKLDVVLNDTNLEKLRKILFYEKQIQEIAMEKQRSKL